MTGSQQSTQLSPQQGILLGNETIVGLLQGAVANGFDPEKMLAKAGIDATAYSDVNAKINGAQLHRLILTIIEEMDDIMMGFTEQPARIAMGEFMMKEFSRCETLGENLKTYSLFRMALREDIGYDLQIDKSRKEVSWRLLHRARKDLDSSWFYWYLLLSNYLSWCRGSGIKFPLKHVSFTFSRPQQDIFLNNYSLFDCDLNFNQPINAVVFDQKFLRLSLTRAPQHNEDFFSLPPQREASLSERVEQALRQLQANGNWSASLSEVAKKIAVGERTLRRQLARENETFTQIKARLRAEYAKHLLLNTDTPVTRIAGLLGFSDPGDFTRAFTRWTQETPSAYRKKHQQQGMS